VVVTRDMGTRDEDDDVLFFVMLLVFSMVYEWMDGCSTACEGGMDGCMV